MQKRKVSFQEYIQNPAQYWDWENTTSEWESIDMGNNRTRQHFTVTLTPTNPIEIYQEGYTKTDSVAVSVWEIKNDSPWLIKKLFRQPDIYWQLGVVEYFIQYDILVRIIQIFESKGIDNIIFDDRLVIHLNNTTLQKITDAKSFMKFYNSEVIPNK